MVSLLILVLAYPLVSALIIYYGLKLGKSLYSVIKNEFGLFMGITALYVGVMFLVFFLLHFLLSDTLAFIAYTIVYFLVSVGLKWRTRPSSDIFTTPPDAFKV